MSWKSYYKQKPKRPAPEQGIKVRKIGATWWGQRWIEALEHISRDYLNRLGRGRAYARAGRVHDLQIEPGKVTALVTGSEDEPYAVTLRVALLSPASWKKVIAAMSEQAVFSAELLAGRMPADIEDAFRAAGHGLFLAKQRELETDCSCPDWANPCKHVAAVHYVLGEAFDKDPFLLFELRGRTKQQVLGALRALRLGQADAQIEKLAADVAEHAARVANNSTALAQRAPEEYDRLATPLPSMQFRMTAPAVSGAILKQLGPPPSWPDDDPNMAALVKRIAAASRMAREWALQTAAEDDSSE